MIVCFGLVTIKPRYHLRGNKYTIMYIIIIKRQYSDKGLENEYYLQLWQRISLLKMSKMLFIPRKEFFLRYNKRKEKINNT